MLSRFFGWLLNYALKLMGDLVSRRASVLSMSDPKVISFPGRENNLSSLMVENWSGGSDVDVILSRVRSWYAGAVDEKVISRIDMITFNILFLRVFILSTEKTPFSIERG